MIIGWLKLWTLDWVTRMHISKSWTTSLQNVISPTLTCIFSVKYLFPWILKVFFFSPLMMLYNDHIQIVAHTKKEFLQALYFVLSWSKFFADVLSLVRLNTCYYVILCHCNSLLNWTVVYSMNYNQFIFACNVYLIRIYSC